jgi:hypothetical protein
MVAETLAAYAAANTIHTCKTCLNGISFPLGGTQLLEAQPEMATNAEAMVPLPQNCDSTNISLFVKLNNIVISLLYLGVRSDQTRR